jgi:hypothetical protein
MHWFPETGLDERRTLLDTAIGIEFAWVGYETFVKRALSQVVRIRYQVNIASEPRD